MGILENLSFESVTAITTNPIMIVAVVVGWLLVLLLYVGVGFLSTATGKKSMKMIQTKEFWVGFVIWAVIYPLVYVGLVLFPIWLKILD